MKNMLKICAVLMILAAASAACAQPVLINQPAYDGMRFYVYRPYNIPEGWYSTYDGYPVFKNWNGVWFYGSTHGSTIVPTSYVVGSVVPSVVGLVPWTAVPSALPMPMVTTVPAGGFMPAPVRGITSVPAGLVPASVSHVLPSTAAPVIQPQPIVSVATPPAPVTEVPLTTVVPSMPVYVPEWSSNPNFLAIGRWEKSVDCIGVLRRPALPVAWKGRYPKVVYAWTGTTWYQITCREYERPIDALRRELYEITCMANRNNAKWHDEDMALLPQYAAVWGYEWMGQIVLAH